MWIRDGSVISLIILFTSGQVRRERQVFCSPHPSPVEAGFVVKCEKNPTWGSRLAA